MTFVPQAFERVRALLARLWKPSTRDRAHVAHSRPISPAMAPPYAVEPSPEVWGALLVLARLRRTGRTPVPPHVQQNQHDQPETDSLVRTYVLSTPERQQARPARQFTEASR